MYLLDFERELTGPEEDYVCEGCGRNCKSGSGLASHRRVCGKRPSDDELIAMRAMSLSYAAISERLDVSETTVGKWLREIEARNGREAEVAVQVKLFHHLAPAKGNWRMRCLDYWGKPLCPVLEECVLFMDLGLWALCEAPDETDVLKAEHLGIMYEAFIGLMRRKIEKWYSEGRRGGTSKQASATASQRSKEGEIGP